MEVYVRVYNEFYGLIRLAFLKIALEGKFPKDGVGEDSPTLWEDYKNKTPIAVQLFGGGNNSNPKYFHRKFLEFNKINLPTGEIDNLSFYKGLKYIELSKTNDVIKVADIQPHPHVPIEKQVATLYKEFVNEYCSDFMVMSDKQDLIESANGNENYDRFENSSSVSKNHLLLVKPSKELLVKSLIETFYSNLSVKENIIDAWHLLSPDYRQNNLKNDFEKFYAGYQNFTGSKALHVFNFIENFSGDVDCLVYYEDEIQAYSSIELSGLEAMTVQHLNLFVERVMTLQSNVEKYSKKPESDGASFGSIELYKLFDPVVTEYIWFRCGIPIEHHLKLFSTKRSMLVKRLYECRCGLINGSWYIKRITQSKTYSSR